MRVFKRSILLFCTLILTFSIISTSIQTKSMLFGSGKADDLVSYYGISNQVTKKYQEKDKNITNIKVTLDTIEHQVKVPVLSQSHLNYAYNMALLQVRVSSSIMKLKSTIKKWMQHLCLLNSTEI